MKAYKTWEVIKMLVDNPKLIFESTGVPLSLGVTLYVDKNEYLRAVFNDKSSIDGNIKIGGEWKLVQKEVTFIEALNSGRKFRYRTWVNGYYDLKHVLYHLGRDYDSEAVKTMFIKKAWIIEEEI